MASTPSASALSAVLRCRRNIWTAPSARLTGSSARDLPVKTASLREALSRGERLVLGRLALSWNKRQTTTVKESPGVSQHAHGQGHARGPAPVCTRPSLCAPRAKVVFVCEHALSARPRGLDITDPRGACGSLTSILSHFVSGRVQLRSRTTDRDQDLDRDRDRDQDQDQDQDSDHREEPQGPRAAAAAAADSCPGEGSVGGTRVTEDRPD